MERINNGWEFSPCWSEAFLKGEGAGEAVRLPHNVKELPLHYADRSDYELLCGYRKKLTLPGEARDGRVFLQFDGAAHIATVYCNGRELTTHRCGYTAFRAEITDSAVFGGENLIAVKLNTTENPAVPPFGYVIDYLTYGGLYRDVWLDIRPKKLIEDVFIRTPDLITAMVSCEAELSPRDALRFEIFDGEGKLLSDITAAPGKKEISLLVRGARPWSLREPALCRCRVTLMEERWKAGDVREVTFGFRTAEFKADGFYLNGEKVFIRGLNRHQAYPYIGYAAPEQLQREDARILRHELQCNAVRTSHYPQSPYFIDQCDREGLLVFTEMPGWQHIGDEAWKDQACENVREMVLQYRNHPSIILWGVRINESLDDDAFYTRTNAIAHELDPSRATSGVRYLEKSHLLEDVYAYNDFTHSGSNAGVKAKKEVSPDMNKALLISECNGHMYPTKPCDSWAHRQEQALRHARVLDAAMADGGHVGFFAWCMFDYATHKDFGSGDRICYHGVLDSFRNPKLAAALYASQGEEQSVLEIGSPLDIGDYPASKPGEIYAFTNADQVELYKNGDYVTTVRPRGWSGLKHGPMPIEDTIGCLLETKEGFPKAKAEALRDCLLAAKDCNINNPPFKVKMKMLSCMLRFGMSFRDGVELYGKYVGNWGGSATVWRFDAKKDGRVVASVTKCPSHKLHLEAKASHTRLTEGEVYDMAAIRVRLLDEFGNLAPYAQLPVRFQVTGAAALVGPATVTAEGGSCGAYLRTLGRGGEATVTVSTDQTEPVTLRFQIENREER